MLLFPWVPRWLKRRGRRVVPPGMSKSELSAFCATFGRLGMSIRPARQSNSCPHDGPDLEQNANLSRRINVFWVAQSKCLRIEILERRQGATTRSSSSAKADDPVFQRRQ